MVLSGTEILTYDVVGGISKYEEPHDQSGTTMLPMRFRRSIRHTIMKKTNLADLYDLPIVDWSTIEARLAQGVTQAPGTGGPDRHTSWLATINGDGSPHVTGVGALWFEGSFWFETGEGTRKGRNLARDARCTLSIATHEFDLVVDGMAEKITDPAVVATMAEQWNANGWPARVDDSGLALTADYSAPSAGPPPWSIFRLVAHQATSILIAEPGGATRWRFDPA